MYEQVASPAVNTRGSEDTSLSFIFLHYKDPFATYSDYWTVK